MLQVKIKIDNNIFEISDEETGLKVENLHIFDQNFETWRLHIYDYDGRNV